MTTTAHNIYDLWEIDPKTEKPLFFVSIEIIEQDEKVKIHSSFPIDAMKEIYNISPLFEETEKRLTLEIKNNHPCNFKPAAKEIAETLKQLPGIEDFFLPEELILNGHLSSDTKTNLNSNDFRTNLIQHYEWDTSIILHHNYDFFTSLALVQIENGINDIYDLDPWFQRILLELIQQKLSLGKMIEFDKMNTDESKGIQALHHLFKEIGICYYDEEENKIWVINKEDNLQYVVNLRE